MLAGSLNRRIRLRRADLVLNDFGEQIEEWRDIAIVWAAKTDVGDNKFFASQEISAEVTVRFQIRYSARFRDLTPRDRLVFEDREFDIASVREIGLHNGLEITASARADPVSDMIVQR